MASPPSELNLDCKPQENNYSMLLKSFGEHPQQPDQTQKIEDFLAHLEEERLKIDAFKRELPLCMQLLNNAMETSRQQLQNCRGNNQGQRPVLEEFIPITKHSASEGDSDQKAISNISDKANWMTSAQLWSQESDGLLMNNKTTTSPNDQIDSHHHHHHHHIGIGTNFGSPKLGLDTKPRIGGAFLPFSKERNGCRNPGIADLALSASGHKETRPHEDKKCSEIINAHQETHNGKEGNGSSGNGAAEAQTPPPPPPPQANSNNSQAHRKARRCWSPDLHRRFVNALQMLGGSQVATPKQIRELMKVDGLTNDEVKSHLQKYRLHTRRPSPSPQAAGATSPQLLVLGSIWVPPEYGGAPATLYGAHHPTSHAPPPPHYCAPPPVPQDFYPAPQHHHHHQGLFRHQLHSYKASPQNTGGSPEPEVRVSGGGGDRSESIEDGKSDSGGSGEEGGERKGLASLRDDGEESNASEITLKF